MKWLIILIPVIILSVLAPVYALPAAAGANGSSAANNTRGSGGITTAIAHVPSFVASLLGQIGTFFKNGVVGMGKALSSWIHSIFSPPRPAVTHKPSNSSKINSSNSNSSNVT